MRLEAVLPLPRPLPAVGCSPSELKQSAMHAVAPAWSAGPHATDATDAEQSAEPPALAVRFRYASRRVGASELIEDYCVDASLDDAEVRSFDTPPDALLGACPAGVTCSSASVHKSGPIEPAYFLAAAHLALMGIGVKNASIQNKYTEHAAQTISNAASLTKHVGVQEVRFSLNEHTSCLYRLKLFEDKLTQGRTDLERFTAILPKVASAVSSHTLWMERSATTEGGEQLLMNGESSSESYGEGVFLQRELLCENKVGEISPLSAPHIRFWAREVGDEWVVEAAAARPAP